MSSIVATCPAVKGGSILRAPFPPRPVPVTPPRETLPHYVATSGPDGVIDTALSLGHLVSLLESEWDLDDEDLVIWRVWEDGSRGPRAAALMRSGASGKPTVLFL